MSNRETSPDDARRHRHEASQFGIWVFLVTEMMFFGGVIGAFLVYRGMYSAAFAAASRHMDLVLGTLNTAVLLTSSFLVALGVRAAELGANRSVSRRFAVTALLGVVFLFIKGMEYREHIESGLWPGSSFVYPGSAPLQAKLYFGFYFVTTGLHALHVLIGIGVLSVLAWKARRGVYSPAYYTPVDVGALYWHFVDIVWIFLFPILYLIGRPG